jgi:hypothetical protein
MFLEREELEHAIVAFKEVMAHEVGFEETKAELEHLLRERAINVEKWTTTRTSVLTKVQLLRMQSALSQAKRASHIRLSKSQGCRR